MDVDDFIPLFTKDCFGNDWDPFYINNDGKLVDEKDDFTFLLDEKFDELDDWCNYDSSDWVNRLSERELMEKRKMKLLQRKSEIVRKRLVFQDIWSEMHFDFTFQWDPCKKIECKYCQKKAPILLVLCPFCNDAKCPNCSYSQPRCSICDFHNYPNPPHYYRRLLFYDQLGWTFFTEIDGFKKRFKNFCKVTMGEPYEDLLKQWNHLIEDLTELIKEIK
jgi:hypothetical protein